MLTCPIEPIKVGSAGDQADPRMVEGLGRDELWKLFEFIAVSRHTLRGFDRKIASTGKVVKSGAWPVVSRKGRACSLALRMLISLADT